MKSIDARTKEAVTGLIEETFSRLTRPPISSPHSGLTYLVKEVISQTEDLTDAVNEYRISTRMEADFFMWVKKQEYEKLPKSIFAVHTISWPIKLSVLWNPVFPVDSGFRFQVENTILFTKTFAKQLPVFAMKLQRWMYLSSQP